MSIEDDRWRDEIEFWLSPSTFCKIRVAKDAVMVLPQARGIVQGADVQAVWADAERWDQVSFSDEIVLEHGDCFVLAYEARAEAKDRVFRALCGSTYCRSGERWQMIAHHRSALG